jgi:hypothetical protein
MSVVYPTALRTTRMTAVLTALDIGANAKLVIMTSADAVLATITLADPSATVTNGVLTLAGVPLSATASGTGTAAKAKLVTSADADVVTGLTVGTGSENIVLGTTSINTGNTVTLTAGTITHG